MDRTQLTSSTLLTSSTPRGLASALGSIFITLSLGAGVLTAGCQKPDAKTPATTQAADEGAKTSPTDSGAEDASVIRTEDFESGSLDSLDLHEGETDNGDEAEEVSTEPQESQGAVD
jgi:hypothetical protein